MALRNALVTGLAAAMLAGMALPAGASPKVAIYSFGGTATDGFNPSGSLVMDKHANFYGTTFNGGASGFGTVFTVNQQGVYASLYSFTGGADGGIPMASLIINSQDWLFGTSQGGGKHGFGAVFRLTPPPMGQTAWKQKVIYSFKGGTDGGFPATPLVEDAMGNLYGTTPTGGPANAGTVYKLTQAGLKTILYAFNGYTIPNQPDGSNPSSGLVMDAGGNLYGVTKGGGTSSECGFSGCGTVYEVTPSGAEKVLYSFTGLLPDGAQPAGNLLLLGSTLWGTTPYTIFWVPNTGGSDTVVHSLACTLVDGCNPYGPLVADASGVLYGTTSNGGKYNQGIAFSLTQAGVETVIHNFGPDAEQPFAGLVFGKNGFLYGTTAWGGLYGGGAVVRVAP